MSGIGGVKVTHLKGNTHTHTRHLGGEGRRRVAEAKGGGTGGGGGRSLRNLIKDPRRPSSSFHVYLIQLGVSLYSVITVVYVVVTMPTHLQPPGMRTGRDVNFHLSEEGFRPLVKLYRYCGS